MWFALLTSASGAVQQVPPDRVVTIDGKAVAATIVRIGGGVVTFADAAATEQRIPLDSVRRIELSGAVERPRQPDGLWLRTGQSLPAVFAAATAESVTVSVPLTSQRLEFPWRLVQAVRLAAPEAEVDPAFAARVADPASDADTLYAIHPDGSLRRFSLRFVDVTGDTLAVEFGGSSRTMAVSKVYGIVFGRDRGAPADALPPPRVSLQLSSGRRLTGQLVSLGGGRCKLLLDEGVELVIPRDAIATIDVRSDKLLDLTTLDPAVAQTAAFDRKWPWLRNRAPGGATIRMAGRDYARGLVLIPRTRLTYRLDGSYDVFETTIGMDERAGKAANAVFRVWGDGAVLFDSGPVTATTPPRVLQVPVADVHQLGLEVDFGEQLDIGDLCVFASPRLRKKD